MFEIFFTAEAKRYLKKFDKQNKIRIISSLERIRIRPYPHVKKLVASPYFRLRVGKYRVILDIDKGKLIILVITIGHRKSIYK